MPERSIASIIVPAGIVLASGVLGMFLQRSVLVRLGRAAEKSSAVWDDILIKSLRGVIFVWTLLAGLAGALRYLRLRPAAGRTLIQALTILAILSVTYFVARLATGYVTLGLGRVAGFPVAFLRNLTWLGIGSLGVLTILDFLKVRLTPLLTALGVGGLAVSLALQDTLSNLFAGLHILATRKVRPGDYVKLQSGEEGYVRDISWRNTTVEALAGNLIIIPNNKLASGILTNFDLPMSDSAVLVEFGVAYKTDLRKCEEVVVEVAKAIMARVPGGVADFTPFVRFHTFGDFAIQGTVILRGGRFVDRFLIKHEFVKELHERFAREGIEIPFPVRTVQIQRSEG
jgi:small-conductance mechanosensitive channel